MWTRKELKDRAKSVLSQNYLIAFAVSLVIAFAGGQQGFSGNGSGYRYNTSREFTFFNFHNGFMHWHFDNFIPWNFDGYIPWNFFAGSFIIFLVIMALRIFIGYSLEVGGTRYFVKSAERNNNRGCFGFAFASNNYKGIIGTMLLTKILIFLWTLLLIIPGIIKAYAYRMVPYILADNPNLGASEAISLSNEMTRGHKFDMFILDVSFLGWYILGALAFGIGIFFVMPYQNATNAELYLILRNNALENGMCSYEDLLLDRPFSNDNIW